MDHHLSLTTHYKKKVIILIEKNIELNIYKIYKVLLPNKLSDLIHIFSVLSFLALSFLKISSDYPLYSLIPFIIPVLLG